MGYHTAAEIPNYWAYAKNFVLDDHMFEPVKSWSLPDHLYMVSGWSAKCRNRSADELRQRHRGTLRGRRSSTDAVHNEVTTGKTSIDLAWTDITWLLYAHHVSWAYYVQTGTQPDCADDSAMTCAPVNQSAATPGIWNPLPLFGDVQQDHQLGNIQAARLTSCAPAKAGTLPAVSWVVPSQPDSEHPPASVHQGQAYITALINAVMKSPDWDSTAIFLAWDDWGGFYDNVVPPTVDANGYGLRVPAHGHLARTPSRATSTTRSLSSDAYLKFIEDDFLGGSRLNPATDGRPDPRPDVREDGRNARQPASRTSTSASRLDRRSCCRPTRRPTHWQSRPGSPASPRASGARIHRPASHIRSRGSERWSAPAARRLRLAAEIGQCEAGFRRRLEFGIWIVAFAQPLDEDCVHDRNEADGRHRPQHAHGDLLVGNGAQGGRRPSLAANGCRA